MVNGPSPGPAPAAQARDSNSRLTRPNWQPVAAQESSQGGWRLTTRVGQLSRRYVGVVNEVAPKRPRSETWLSTTFTQAQVPRVTGRSSPALATRWSSKAIRAVGMVACSNRVLLVLGSALLFQNHYPRFTGAPSKPLQDTDSTPSFGGFGLSPRARPAIVSTRMSWSSQSARVESVTERTAARSRRR